MHFQVCRVSGSESSETDNAGRTLSYQYLGDCSGRIYKKICADLGIDMEYSYSGLTVTETNKKDNTTSTSTHDGAGNLVASGGTNGTVTYDYFPSGKLKSATTDGRSINNTYYPETQKLWTVSDPDMGIITYTYNGFGQVKTKLDAKNQTKTYTYDDYGRLQAVTGTGSTLNVAFSYTSTPGKLGLLESVTRDGVTESYTYDNLCRPLTTTTTGPVIPGAAGTSFTTTYTYDPTTAHLATVAYPTGLKVAYAYDGVGNLTRIDNSNTGGNIWTGNTANTANQWTQFTLGNGLVTKVGYGTEGLISSIQTGTTSNPTSIQNLGYTYNSLKQETNRTDGTLSEDFTYDNLNRLVSDGLTGQPQYLHKYKFLAGGNIDSTSIAGKYSYQATQPHAASSAGGIITATSGNSSPSINCSSTYNIDNMTLSIDNGTYHDDFTYGPGGHRFRLDVKVNSTLQSTKVYVGNCEFGYSATGVQLYARTIISAPSGVCAVWQDSVGTAQDGTFYIHTDNQDSWLAITNSTGTVTNRYSYDAWGRPRDYQTWYLKTVGITTPVATLAALQPRFDRGYTGHEHMAAFGLINMNGRIYDPYLQRFLSPDPYIQDPDDAQNYNRYSYCLNNPLMFTDPSGYNWFKKALKKVCNVVSDAADKVSDVAVDAYKTTCNAVSTVVSVTADAIGDAATYINDVDHLAGIIFTAGGLATVAIGIITLNPGTIIVGLPILGFGIHDLLKGTKNNKTTGTGSFSNTDNGSDPNEGKSIVRSIELTLPNETISQENNDWCMYANYQTLYNYYGRNYSQTAIRDKYKSIYRDETPDSGPDYRRMVQSNMLKFLSCTQTGQRTAFEQEIYSYLERGYPVLCKVFNSSADMHGVTIIGMTEYADGSKTAKYYDPNMNLNSHIQYMDWGWFYSNFAGQADAITGIGPAIP